MTLEQTVILLSKRFSENDLPFCLAGGFAYSLYCEPRTTVDIDIVIFSAVKKEKINEILLKSFQSVYEEEIFSRCRYIRFADAELPVISPEDLFIIKTASSRKQDNLDAEKIVQELGPSLDMEYIQKQRGLIENPGQGGGGEK